MNYSVEAGSVKARVPVVIFRNKLAERTTYYLRLEIVENDFFKTGVKTELHRTVVFSKDLLKPAGEDIWKVLFWDLIASINTCG
ncbi:MAG: hypothetical protein ACLTZU_04250 [Odoribacter splanchnicus]